jgi:predicted DNA repair protein MutK
MFMVGGGILTHGLPGAHALIHDAQQAAAALPGLGSPLAALAPSLLDALAGLLAGALALALVGLAGKAWRALKPPR